MCLLLCESFSVTCPKFLNHVRGPKSFDDLLTVSGVHYLAFKQEAEKLGILQEDDNIEQCLLEARSFKTPSALRRLFAKILAPGGVRSLWEENYEDYPSSSSHNHTFTTNKLLSDVNHILMQHNRSLREFDLPELFASFHDTPRTSRLVEEQLSMQECADDLNYENCIRHHTSINGKKAVLVHFYGVIVTHKHHFIISGIDSHELTNQVNFNWMKAN